MTTVAHPLPELHCLLLPLLPAMPACAQVQQSSFRCSARSIAAGRKRVPMALTQPHQSQLASVELLTLPQPCPLPTSYDLEARGSLQRIIRRALAAMEGRGNMVRLGPRHRIVVTAGAAAAAVVLACAPLAPVTSSWAGRCNFSSRGWGHHHNARRKHACQHHSFCVILCDF